MNYLRNRYFFFLDVVFLGASPFLLFALRFEGFRWPPGYLDACLEFTVLGVTIQMVVYLAFGLYRRFWRFASTSELKLIFTAGLVAGVCNMIMGRFLVGLIADPWPSVPMSVLFSYALLSVAIIAAPRLYVRVRELTSRQRPRSVADKRALIVGAGAAGHMIARELRLHPTLELSPVGFVDDDRDIHGLRLENLPVYGSLEEIPKLVEAHRIDEIIIAIPGSTGSLIRRIVGLALKAGIKARTIPGLGEIISGKVDIAELRTIEIHDLLRREPITTNLEKVMTLAKGATVLVTGAGGSIGSELCRQLADLEPAKIVLVGRGENSIFDIHNELRAKHPNLTLVPVIADVRDRVRIRRVIERYRPHSIFHAAAHKHVPLMEENPCEAVTNNVMGTKNIVEAAVDYDVDYFVLISTDKAVRPTNVMGATKRVAEHIMKLKSAKAKGTYVAVRFGNVLGSRGSVVPTFVKQIKAGGPVTITHPEMRRFFMTISEAVQLTLQAGAIGENGDLFMLDMGEQVKVVDLAADLIRLSGLEVGTDIEIKFIGTRPGEKLYEEMFWGDEVAEPTEHPKVLRARRTAFDPRIVPLIGELIEAGVENQTDSDVRDLLRQIVPDFVPDAPDRSLTPTEAMVTTPVTRISADTPVVGGNGSGNGNNLSVGRQKAGRNSKPSAAPSL
ncbi:MAG: nucleoside-diphosphate sugar epimerase/dehydratase [Gemmatimonadota bacterium]